MADKLHRTSIGGQAVIEGVMMRGIDKTALSVRLPNQTIDTETWNSKSEKTNKWYCKTPFIRGVFNLVDTFRLGYKCLTLSAEKATDDEELEPSKFEEWLDKKFGDKWMKVLTGLSAVIGVVIAVALFLFLPMYTVKFISSFVDLGGFKTLVEGVMKIIIFILYLGLVSMMKDIKRVFQYHGAEHKSIACYEAGEELTVENVRGFTRFHPRCGTSFLLIVLIISILVHALFPWHNMFLRLGLSLLFLPVIASVSYEIIKFAGRHDNLFSRVISAPGLWLQRLTTREPDDSQIEVGIASLVAVLPKEGQDDRW
ncbi:DUF1385 domain-containing protein [Candidatus Soleaferrea massiliensis]|uniref:DUF1385 domain-containing protein n=1 Tax=Candidatus Soleaferrea massiliensis TaxID=1470354 RepID=UPI00058EA847|nr:DUF1385 domain-containing protein [Candidatus Soleaferrea massiliensis]